MVGTSEHVRVPFESGPQLLPTYRPREAVRDVGFRSLRLQSYLR